MKKITEIADGIHYVGVNDRTKQYFEALWPLPEGISYNSYLVAGEKIALIDTVDICYTDRFVESVRAAIGGRTLDYLVINHMEPDHSASIGAVRDIWPGITIVGNSKTIQMVDGFYGITDNTLTVSEGDTLPLGGGLSLTFAMIPMVHWPETMVTYCPERRLAFTGDALGTFGAIDGGITDSQLDIDPFRDEMVRYYANIVGKYGGPVQKALQKLAALELDTICSTHGPVWQKEIPRVIDLYDRLSRYEGGDGVVIAYGSMYGNTELTAERMARELASLGVKEIKMHNLSKSHCSYALRDIFKYRAVLIGSPTYNGHLFPEVQTLVAAIEQRGVTGRVFACFGGYSWAGAAVKLLTEFAERMKWDIAAPGVEVKQGYSDEKTEACAETARAIAAKLG